MPIAAPLLYEHSHAADSPVRGPIIAGADISLLRSEQDIQRPGRLRRIAVAYLRLWKLPQLTDTARVLMSELVTNAFQHGVGEVVSVRLYVTATDLCIEVDDGSPWVPRRDPAEPLAQGGRGLFLVDGLADAWGVTEDGARVWCVISRNLGTPEGHR